MGGKKTTDAPLPFGRVVKPHGMKGWLKVKPFRQDSDALLKVRSVFLISERGVDRVDVRSARKDRLGFLLALRGCDDRDKAATFQGAEIALPRDELDPLESDEFYLVDLVGARAVDPEGVALGEVTRVHASTAQGLIVLRNDERELMVPAVPEIVVDLDLSEGWVVLDLPEGLPEERLRSDEPGAAR